MAEPRPVTWSRWSLPRLPDEPDPDPWATSCQLRLDREAEVWHDLAGWLELGWHVTPPVYTAETREWICVAFNVQGCSASQAGAAGIGVDRRTAIADLGAYFKFQVDIECSRPGEHGRPE